MTKRVYGLIDLSKPDSLRYIGSTRSNLVERFGQHLTVGRLGGKFLVSSWIDHVIKAGGSIGYIDLTEIDDVSELTWIDTANAVGHKLLNVLGNGNSHSKRLKAAWRDPVKRAAMLNRDEELRKRRSVEGVKSDASRLKVGLVGLNRVVSQSARKKISKTLSDRKLSAHSKQRRIVESEAIRLWHRERNIESIRAMDLVWLRLLRDVVKHGANVRPRGQLTKELLSSLIIVDMTRPILTIVERKMGYRFMCAEAAWLLSGDDRVATIAPYAPMISKFSDNGRTFFGAYGPKLRSQLNFVIKTLKADRDSRQAVINIWRENPPKTRDFPCTLSCQFMIRDNTLHAFVTMRSSDVWLGVVYDVPSMSMWAAYVLLSLKDETLKLGNLYQVAASRHLYERNFDSAQKCLDKMTIGFQYAPFDSSEFKTPTDLINHLWKLARCEKTKHRWLHEIESRNKT